MTCILHYVIIQKAFRILAFSQHFSFPEVSLATLCKVRFWADWSQCKFKKKENRRNTLYPGNVCRINPVLYESRTTHQRKLLELLYVLERFCQSVFFSASFCLKEIFFCWITCKAFPWGIFFNIKKLKYCIGCNSVHGSHLPDSIFKVSCLVIRTVYSTYTRHQLVRAAQSQRKDYQNVCTTLINMYAREVPHIRMRLPPAVSQLFWKSQVEDAFFTESDLKQELNKCF